MWPGGDESRRYELGRSYLYNDGDGTAARGNYEVRVCRKGKHDVTQRQLVAGDGFTRTARVENWPRKSYNIWLLILRALRKAFPEAK